MASERLQWMRNEQARRRTSRAQERHEYESARRQTLQNKSLNRMQGYIAGKSGNPADRYGMTNMQHRDKKEDFADRSAARDVAYITARSPQEVERMRGVNRLDLQRGELDDRVKSRHQASMENAAQRQHESGLQGDRLRVDRERLIAEQGAAARQYGLQRDDLKLRQQQAAWDATAPTYVPGMGMVSRGADGGYSVTSEIDMMEAGLSDEERLARARQRAIDASYARGNWFQDTGNFLFGHPGQ